MAFERDYSFEEIRQMLSENAIQLKELKISQAQTDEQMKRTDEKLERIGIRLGNISNNNGDYAEDFFWHAVKNRKEFEGIKIDYSEANVKPLKREGVEDEFDIIMWNCTSAIIVETKYKVHPDLIQQIKQKKIPNFRVLIPEKKELKIYVAIAGFAMSDEVAELAKREGFFVLRQAGDNMTIEKGEIKAY